MYWPDEIVASFAKALVIEPAEGMDVDEIILTLLDETAKRAVWRAKGDPDQLGPALRSPYTPLGSVVADGIEGKAIRLTLKGKLWGPAVDAFYEYVETNAEAVCESFRFDARPYDDSLTDGKGRNGVAPH